MREGPSLSASLLFLLFFISSYYLSAFAAAGMPVIGAIIDRLPSGIGADQHTIPALPHEAAVLVDPPIWAEALTVASNPPIT